MGITRADAEAIARRELQTLQGDTVEVAILEEHTREHDLGWTFYYESRRFLETGNPSDRLAGNAPLVVDRHGHVHWLRTSAPPDVGLAELRAELNRT